MKCIKTIGHATVQWKSALVVLFLFSSVFSSAQAEKKTDSKTTVIPEAIQRMEKLLGEWEGNIPSITGPVVTSKTVKTNYSFSRVFKNQAVKMESGFQSIEDKKVTECYSVIAYDTSLKELHMMMVSNEGNVYELSGSWMNKYNLNFNCNTVRNGKKVGITLWFGLKNAEWIDYRMYTTIGNDLLITEEGKLLKKTQQPKEK